MALELCKYNYAMFQLVRYYVIFRFHTQFHKLRSFFALKSVRGTKFGHANVHLHYFFTIFHHLSTKPRNPMKSTVHDHIESPAIR